MVFTCFSFRCLVLWQHFKFEWLHAQVLSSLFPEIVNAGCVERWKENRRLCRTALRASGVGGEVGENRIQREVDELVAYLSEHQRLPLLVVIQLENLCANVICGALFGRRYSSDERDLLQRFFEMNRNVLLAMRTAYSPDMQGPCLTSWFLRIMRRRTVKQVETYMREIREFVGREVRQHRETLDAAGPRDFVDSLLVAGVPERRLIDTVIMFMVDAVVNLSALLVWSVKWLATQREEQERLRREVERVCGSGGGARRPRLADREAMPCVKAFITEVQRLASVGKLRCACTRQQWNPIDMRWALDFTVGSREHTCESCEATKFQTVLASFWSFCEIKFRLCGFRSNLRGAQGDQSDNIPWIV